MLSSHACRMADALSPAAVLHASLVLYWEAAKGYYCVGSSFRLIEMLSVIHRLAQHWCWGH